MDSAQGTIPEADLCFTPKLLRSRHPVALSRGSLGFFKVLYVAKVKAKRGRKERKKKEQNRKTVERKGDMGTQGGRKRREKREERSQLCSGDHLLEGAGIADGDRREVHGLEAHGERDADLPA